MSEIKLNRDGFAFLEIDIRPPYGTLTMKTEFANLI